MYSIFIILILCMYISARWITCKNDQHISDIIRRSILISFIAMLASIFILLGIGELCLKNPKNTQTTCSIIKLKKFSTSAEIGDNIFLVEEHKNNILKYGFLTESEDGVLIYNLIDVDNIEIDEGLKDTSPYLEKLTTTLKPEINNWVFTLRHKPKYILHIKPEMELLDNKLN